MTPVLKIILLCSVFFLCLSRAEMSAEDRATVKSSDEALTEQYLKSGIEFLSSSLCAGRGTGSAGNTEASFWICRQMELTGAFPLGNHGYSHSFICPNGAIGRNLLGMIPGTGAGADRYIILIAHYDNLGILQGNFYPGADSNASGVAAMLGISNMFRRTIENGHPFPANIIFAALDGKNLSMSGAEALWEEINDARLTDPLTGKVITKDKVKMVANLDILGSTLEPLNSGREDFMIMLGGNSFRKILSSANSRYGANLELAYDYYGSEDFTNMFLNRIGDQKVFLEHGINAVLFTSGITMVTNKMSDLPSIINYPVLRRRCTLIFHWIEGVIQELL